MIQHCSSVPPLSPLQFRSAAQSSCSVQLSSVLLFSPVQFRSAAQSSSVPFSCSVQFRSVQPLSPVQFRSVAQSSSVPFSRSVHFSSVQLLSPVQFHSVAQSSSVQFRSGPQSCPTLCDLMDCSTPGLPVHHQLPEPAQTHVHGVGDAIHPSHPLSSPSPAFNLPQHQGLFQ